jgi:RNA polymerase sigma-70 factor, ECF subfamily
MNAVSSALHETLRRERRRVVALLARKLGLAQLAQAEDAVQQAALKALELWPREGLPGNPAAWLYRVAQRALIDALRADQRLVALPEDDSLDADTLPAIAATTAPAGRFAGELDDDELALLFAACHPALPAATQVALALRAVAGLELAPIAAGLLTSEAALAQRLARARTQLAGVSLALPAGAELAPRREAVLASLVLMFHAGLRGMGRSGGPEQGGPEQRGPDTAPLCWEAIRLARALAAHPAPAHADADAVAALLLLHGARLTGRIDAAGDIVPLPGQPRDRWDAGMVRMGLVHLQAAQRAERVSRWHLQAGIAAEHALAPSYEATDWAAIVRYYELLLALDDSPAPRLAHAIALAEAPDAARWPQARASLQALLPQMPTALRAHTLAALARAHERLGEPDAALRRLAEAVAAAPHPADARLLARRLAQLGQARS